MNYNGEVNIIRLRYPGPSEPSADPLVMSQKALIKGGLGSFRRSVWLCCHPEALTEKNIFFIEVLTQLTKQQQ